MGAFVRNAWNWVDFVLIFASLAALGQARAARCRPATARARRSGGVDGCAEAERPRGDGSTHAAAAGGGRGGGAQSGNSGDYVAMRLARVLRVIRLFGELGGEGRRSNGHLVPPGQCGR